MDKVVKEAKDTTNGSYKKNTINLEGLAINKYLIYQKKHPKINIDAALDSLQQDKTFYNRFLYSRAEIINSFIDESDSREQFQNQFLSYGSISLFILLPIFTLFLKLIYIRRKHLYVAHLIFVFHTQTVFFLLLSIYFLLDIFQLNPQLYIFTILFLIYLYLAMLRFYEQGYFKTFIKFILLNFSYSIIAIVGIMLVTLVSFALF